MADIYPINTPATATPNEGSDLTNWVADRATMTVDTVDPQNGTSTVKGVAIDANIFPSIQYRVPTGVLIGKIVRLDFWCKGDKPGASLNMYSPVQTIEYPLDADGTWKFYSVEYTFDSDANTHFRFYIDYVAGDGTGSVWVDNFQIWEEPFPTTTTVEVEWIDSISAAATGNKIYRDDIEIADIANGVQIYQDATAETGTEYKYEVQAYSATDETTQEVLGVNVQYITTA